MKIIKEELFIPEDPSGRVLHSTANAAFLRSELRVRIEGVDMRVREITSVAEYRAAPDALLGHVRQKMRDKILAHIAKDLFG